VTARGMDRVPLTPKRLEGVTFQSRARHRADGVTKIEPKGRGIADTERGSNFGKSLVGYVGRASG